MNTANTMIETQNQTPDAASHTREMLQHGTERVMEMKDRVWDKSKVLARDMDTCVHEHTWMALGITAAVGIILGLAVSRR